MTEPTQVMAGFEGWTDSKIRLYQRKQRFLTTFRATDTLEEALQVTGVSARAVHEWRKNDADFSRSYKAILNAKRTALPKGKLTVFDPFRELEDPEDLETFRRKVFGFPSTPTHQAFCKAYDDKTNLVIFWVAPAGAGKDVTAMQSVAHAAASGLDRMGCIMESEPQAKKRIDAYLDPYFTNHAVYQHAPNVPGGTEPEIDFISTWGPWRWEKSLRLPDSTSPPRTKWEAHNKWFVGRTTPQADSSLWAVGLGSAIAGSRVHYLVASDLFTVENQRGLTFRNEQLELINGTINSRLDEAGRLVFLNHHVRKRGESNLVTLIDQYVGTARIVKQEGDYTKYANGVAIIRTPALTVDDEGIVLSYWPERFPVKGTLVLDGESYNADELTGEENQDLADRGARRLRGLAELRDRNSDLFELIYQQNPQTSGYGDFTDEILEACHDTERTLGQAEPNEIRILSVDPAHRGGAAWLLWGLNPETSVFTVIDFWLGEGLGFSGMRTKLIQEPVQRWRPRDLVWEINYESETPHHPEVKEILHKYHVNLVLWRTHYNRSEGEYQVLSMLDDMRMGNIRFPAKTMADVIKMGALKEHFQNFEVVGYTDRRKSRGFARNPDDGCMAAWFGWAHGHTLLAARERKHGRSSTRTSSAVRDAFSGYRI